MSELIVDGFISGRIDSGSGVLYSRVADERSKTFNKSLQMGSQFVRDGRSLLMRMSCVENEFVLKSEKGDEKMSREQHRESQRRG